MRATIVVDRTQPEELAAVEAWLARWAGQLTHQSDDQGCGCCVSIWDIDAPAMALDELPESLRAESEWTRGAA